MTGFVVFDAESGRVKRTGDAPLQMIAIQAGGPGEAVIEWAGERSGIYVDVGALQVHPQSPIDAEPQISGLTVTIAGLPVPCVVQIDHGNPQEVGDGTAEIEFNLPGEYEIRVESVRFLPRVWRVML